MKNAFVQVSKDVNSEKIIIENLYGYKIVVDADNSFEVSQAIPEALPDTSEASEGDVLKLNAQKEPVWGEGASGGGTKLYKHTFDMEPVDGGPSATLHIISPSNSVLTYNDVIASLGKYVEAGGNYVDVVCINNSQYTYPEFNIWFGDPSGSPAHVTVSNEVITEL